MKGCVLILFLFGFVLAASSSILDDLDIDDLYGRGLDDNSAVENLLSDEDFLAYIQGVVEKRGLDLEELDDSDLEAVLNDLRRELDEEDPVTDLQGRNDSLDDRDLDSVAVAKRGRIGSLLRRIFRMAGSKLLGFLRKLGRFLRCIVCRRSRRPLVRTLCRRFNLC